MNDAKRTRAAQPADVATANAANTIQRLIRLQGAKGRQEDIGAEESGDDCQRDANHGLLARDFAEQAIDTRAVQRSRR